MGISNTSPTILIVEDEPLIRMSAVDLVEDAGYRALEASNAEEALQQLNATSDIGIVFTDIDMPGTMDGVDLANIVSMTWPTIGIVVVSGYRRATMKQMPKGGLFFSKPYDFCAISDALRNLLTSGRADVITASNA